MRSVARFLKRRYRRWRALQHFGLTDGGWSGLSAARRAKAIGFLIAVAPMAPLLVTDEMGLTRGWLWHCWAIIAAVWSAFCLAVILHGAWRSFRVALWRHRSLKADGARARPPRD